MDRLPPYGNSREEARFGRTNRDYGSHIQGRAHQLHPRLPDSAVFVGRTAALLHGADVLPPGIEQGFWPVEVAVRRNSGARSLEGVRWYRWDLPAEHITAVSGLPVTTLARTGADCARCLPRLEAVAAVDQLLNLNADQEAMREVLGESVARRHRAQALSVLELAVPGVDSVAESWCRCLICDAGFPTPQVQVPVRIGPYEMAYIDMGYEEFRVGAEYDGREHHTAPRDVDHDLRRRRRVAEVGWGIVAVSHEGVLRAPDRLLLRLFWMLREHGWRVHPEREERIRRRIAYIAMCRRKDRERWIQGYGTHPH